MNIWIKLCLTDIVVIFVCTALDDMYDLDIIENDNWFKTIIITMGGIGMLVLPILVLLVIWNW